MEMSNRPLFLLVPRLADGRIILLQRESSVGDGWQLPVAPLPAEGDLLRAAAQLLHRTTDYVPARLESLGLIHTPAETHCFLAEPLSPSPWPPAAASGIMTSPVHPHELHSLIRSGAIRCGRLLGALMLLDVAERFSRVAVAE